MRQDQWANTLAVQMDGRSVDLGVWDTLGGGDVAWSETKYSPGGMAPQRVLGGAKTVNNITLGRLLDADEKDDWSVLQRMMQQRSEVPATVTRQPLDVEGRPFGAPLVYTGKVIGVAPGDTDSNAEGAQIWTVTISTDATVS